MELKCNPVRAGVDVKIYHIYSTGWWIQKSKLKEIKTACV